MTIHEQAREIPIIDMADICVVGGGTTGCMAAIRAARMGARVVLIEQNGCFGGNGTSGLVFAWHTLLDFDFNQQINSGLTEEIITRLSKRNAVRYVSPDAPGHKSRMSKISSYFLNPEELKIELDEMLKEAGVVCRLHTLFCSPFVENGRLSAVIVEDRDGRGAIRADFFIDATADGMLCKRMGCKERVNEKRQPSTVGQYVTGWDSIMNPKTVLLEHLKEYGLPNLGWDGPVTGDERLQHLLKTNVYQDILTAQGLTDAEMEGRRQARAIMDILNKYGNGERPAALTNLSASIGIREGRCIRCLYTLTGEDLLNGVPFEDAIGYGAYPIDVHHAHKPGCTFWYLNGMTEYELDGYPHEISWWKEPSDDYPRYYQIPFRSLIPLNTENVLVCGRCMDANKQAFAAVRVMVNMNQTGEAAGVAAALCAKRKIAPAQLPYAQLRDAMAEGGSIML